MTTCPFTPGFDFTDPDLIQHRIPAEEFAYLRKTEPIWWNAQPRGVAGFDDDGYWVVTKHADVKEVSRLNEVFSNSVNTTVVRYNEDITAEQLEIQRENLLIDMDEPKHRILRRIVSPLFTSKAVNGLHARLVERAHGIVEEAAEKSSGNFVSDIASVLPMHAIADLVGIPESDRQQVLDWTNQMFAYDDPAIGRDTATTATVSMLGYAYAMAEERQLNPQDDILTGLVRGAYDDRPLTPLEFAYFVIQLMVAGNETSRNAITHGVLAFADNPAQWRLYRERRPSTAADEIIRWASPIIAFQRTALQDVELGGVQIRKDQRVGMFYASANFDEDVFDDPFAFNIERDPNPHLAFGGHGIHYCLGANLARLEIGIMFDALADRLPDLMPTGRPPASARGGSTAWWRCPPTTTAQGLVVDRSNGYEGVATEFIRVRSATIGVTRVRDWATALPRGSAVVDLGCGPGIPLTEVMVAEGLQVYAVDAAPSRPGVSAQSAGHTGCL